MNLSMYRPLCVTCVSLTIMLAALSVLAGCDGLSDGVRVTAERDPAQSRSKEARKEERGAGVGRVHPTKDTEAFYKAVKGATKVVIISSHMGDPLEDREQVPLNTFNSNEEEFWRLTEAVVSATTTGTSQSRRSDYVIRWYDRYNKLGEAKVHKDTGLTKLRHISAPDGKLTPEGNTITGNVFIPKEKIKVIGDAATAFTRQRERELEKARKGTSRGSEI